MRRLSKTESAKSIKTIRELLMSLGAIETTTKNGGDSNGFLYSASDDGSFGFLRPEPNTFIMETIAGLLWLKISCDAGSFTHTVFGRFEDYKKSHEVIGEECRHNSKYNFHCSNLVQLHQMLFFRLGNIVAANRRVITNTNRRAVTDVDVLDLFEGTFEVSEKAVIVMDGKFVTGDRIMIMNATSKNNFDFKNWRGKKIILINGVAHLIAKSTKFQLILDGDME
jgi:hypothetical protein